MRLHRGATRGVLPTTAGRAVPHSHIPPTRSCGTSFRVAVVSSQFEGKRLIERHRMINAALSEVMPGIHALTIAKAVPPTRA